MANEATLQVRYEDPVDMIVADGTGIEKGTILKQTDPLTAAAADGSAQKCAGIAAREKIASDGRTRLAVYRRGVFEVIASGAIPVGSAVQTEGYSNYVRIAAVSTSGAGILGTALETASDEERFLIELNIGAGGAQIT